ncbi:hypothetical protein [Devosia sp.]|uniref:hypothetical protein n=1 Tax=Devosia sp. TaxID=1871048 RepID=UPI001ACF3496|nr:hypothetical protein [Devosia sp.]MBN9333263.1 hypothetical protein [Devosia sp.]
MILSVLASVADKAMRRPEWTERNGDHHVVVRGFSPLDNLAYGAVAAAVILAPIVLFLVSHP